MIRRLFRWSSSVATSGQGMSAADRRFVRNVRELAARYERDPDARLRDRADDLRAEAIRSQLDEEIIRKAFALSLVSMRRALGKDLYDVQLVGSHRLTQPLVAEMQTGEGKTLTCGPAAFAMSLMGQGVHVATPNSYLAERDFTQLQPFFELLGTRVGLLPERESGPRKNAAYACDVTYGTGYEFGFDLLRDQIAVRNVSRSRLGEATLDKLRGTERQPSRKCQRGLAYSIVDEADHVLIDDAASPLVISIAGGEEATDADAHRAALALLTRLQSDVHFIVAGSQGRPSLTSEGLEWIHSAEVDIPLHKLRRPWAQYVQQALAARWVFRRDKHYLVREGEIQIIDQSSGRIFSEREWSDGLHQAIQAKERLRITAELEPAAQITRQRFYRLYRHFSGMTGTIGNCAGELDQVYGLGVAKVPRRFPSRRVVLPLRFFLHREQKWAAIALDVAKRMAAGQPVLVGTNSIRDSEELSERFRAQGINHQLLNGTQDAEEAEIVGHAGEIGCVTIATNLAGRGTDIRLADGVAERGGLHVVVSECHFSSRVDLQLIGRCARQNDPGSAQRFVCTEDALITDYGAWLISTAQRCASWHGEVEMELTAPLARIQKVAERTQFAARNQLLRADLARETLLSRMLKSS